MIDIEERISLPQNVRQTGEMWGDLRIYIEDYVYGYAAGGAYDGRDGDAPPAYGILLGERTSIDGYEYIFIRGAVGLNMQPAGGEGDCVGIDFSRKTWARLDEERERYFPSMSLLGWFCGVMDSQLPGTMETLLGIHMDSFAGGDKVLLALDFAAREEHFYRLEKGRLARQGGYICFYERNEAMQSYMLETRPVASVDSGVQDVVTQNFRNVLRERKAEAEKRHGLSVLYCVCGLMAVVVTVIGVNLVHSFDRMQKLDASVDRIAKEIANMSPEAEDFFGYGGDETTVTKLPGNVYPTEAVTVSSGSVQENPVQETASQDAAGEMTQDGSHAEETAAAALGEVHTETPTSAVSPADAQPVKSYVVKKGDTLMGICKYEYGDAQKYRQLMEANGLTDPDRIYEGQQLVIP